MRSSYTRLVWTINEELRGLLSRPFGPIFSSEEYLGLLRQKSMSRVITVGDVVSSFAVSKGYRPHIAVVDQKTKREGFGFNWRRFRPTKAWNPPGTISLESLVRFVELLNKKKRSVLLVEGEEDMLTLLAILVSPPGYTVFYGQPNQGVVCVEIDKTKRLEAINIFKQMVLEVYE